MGVASAVSTVLIAGQLSPAVAGLPNTAGVLGTAIGAVVIGRLTTWVGRAQALRLGYAVAVAGAALTVLAAVGAPVVLLFAGMLLLGAGNAAALLSRYAAADAATPARRAAAMSTVVWASTAGAVGGPLLLGLAQDTAQSAGLPPLSGAFLLTIAAAFAAVLTSSWIRPTKAGRVDRQEVEPRQAVRSTTLLAAAVMLVGHLVMVALTTSVPVHAHHYGHGLGALGLMLSAHSLGMFAFAPVTGWWIDRSGPRPAMLAGLVTITASALVIAGPAGMTFAPALFLLGYGWNLCYLGGSALLSRAGQARLESKVEAWVWAVAALATAASTWLFAEGGFALLSGISVVLALPLLVVVARSRSVPPVEPLQCPQELSSLA
ncbi:MFS transporter [Kribbella alba]|uniref:MFS transporter n=2 Tax=Kribbella alba TaxID=190197 RepID=A0ABN2FB12_9ACTN